MELATVPTPNLVKYSIAIILLDNWPISKYVVKYIAAFVCKSMFHFTSWIIDKCINHYG